MSVHFDAVSFRYPSGGAGVSDIDLEIGDGELLAVIGPSGSGKTTLLRLLSGFVVPDRGRILIDGRDVARVPVKDRALGVVFQAYALFPHMTAAENVAYPLKLRGVSRTARMARASEALEKVGLGGFANRQPASLSGGQQQRVALARALVFGPRALLLDEPLSALDAGLRAGMRDEILRVQRAAGIATLFVTHDQEEALSMADRVAVLKDGRLLQVDTPRGLYERPVDATVAGFVGHANLWPGRVAADGLVETAIGPIRTATGGFAPGDAVTVMVRPEEVSAEPAADAANRFAGRIAADRFLGNLRRLDLEVPGGLVKVETRRRDAIDAVAIAPEAVRLLPAGL
ncbi:ABC transporter ATP-binding protein [uncultured Tistrella sp.]|uniref:ABC transporter ATP-binding protein n=1 Tax=Tistrella mobilis TaxID=171437 RepID=UPI000C08EA5D|nr:ABC transporter ATP-binding protein [uncultured Tistrella sp.]MAM74560.1 ABC transporter ATP-binding protein [Tistrella sp.]